mgnify:CR=1 FL=1
MAAKRSGHDDHAAGTARAVVASHARVTTHAGIAACTARAAGSVVTLGRLEAELVCGTVVHGFAATLVVRHVDDAFAFGFVARIIDGAPTKRIDTAVARALALRTESNLVALEHDVRLGIRAYQ